MPTFDDLIEAFTHDAGEPDMRASSGFAELDQVTGGIMAGRVWIVTGSPGQGRTTLLTQWAASLAIENWQTHLFCPREPVDFTAARLLACSGRVPLLQLHRREASTALVSAARNKLLGKPLHVAGQGQGTFLDGGDEPDVGPPTALLIDDADLKAGVFPDRVASFARQGALVVLSIPRHLLVLGKGDDWFVDPAWARIADVVVEVRQAGRYDDRLNSRPGEVDLHVIKNRWGPARSLSVGFQGHYSRFVDRATGVTAAP